MARLPSGPREPDEPDDDISSLFGDADDDIDVDDDPDAYEPAFPPVAAPAPPPRPSLPDPREAPPTYDIPELSMQVPPRPDAAPRGPSTAIPADGGAFFWGLTPNDDPDPLVHGDQPDVAGTPPVGDEPHHHHGLVPPTVPLAPYVPFVYEEPVAGSPPAEAASESEPSQDGPGHVDGDRPTANVPREPVPPEPAGPPASDTIAVPSWSPAPDPRHPAGPVEPPATPSVQAELPPAELPSAEPEAGHALPPGTVELPWLRRSRRSEQRQDAEPTSAMPGVPDEPAADAGQSAPAWWEQPGVASTPPPVPSTERDDAPPDPSASSSWSLFGDLFDDEDESQRAPEARHEDDAAGTVEHGEASAGAGDAQPPLAGAGHSAAGDLPTTDIFAAFNAAAAAAGLPGLEASEIAAYDIPESGTPEPVRPWDQPAETLEPGSKGPGGAAAADPASTARGSEPARSARDARASSGPSSSGDSGQGGYAAGGSAAGRSGGFGSGGSGSGGSGSRPGRRPDEGDGGPSPRAQRIMLIIAGALLLVLLLIALFIVGRAVAHPDAAASPTPTKTATPTPTPTPTVAAKGPVAPGKHPWNALLGGECLQPFTTPWADTFTVVACTTPHAGQLVYTGVITGDATAAFPGSDQLASQVGALCTRAGIVNLAAAAKYGDVQIQTSYPVTETQWKQGQRSYYCFVNRASGQPITDSLAGPGPK